MSSLPNGLQLLLVGVAVAVVFVSERRRLTPPAATPATTCEQEGRACARHEEYVTEYPERVVTVWACPVCGTPSMVTSVARAVQP